MKCFYCGSDDHPWFNCRKKPEGWKPPKRAHVPQSGRVGNPSPPLLTKQPDEPIGETARSLRPSQGGSVGGAGQTLSKPRGRPRTGFDKKAYDKERMKKARAALKAKRNG